jgi:hypothetical protein
MSRFRIVPALAGATALAAVLVPATALAASRPTATASTSPRVRTTATTVAPTATAAGTTYENRLVETFDDAATWWNDWGLPKLPGNTAVDVSTPNNFLSVVWWDGGHDGASWFLKTGTSDAAHLQYKMRLSANFDASVSASDVKLVGFGNPVLAADGSCVVACGGNAADGVTGYSARSDINDSGVPGHYVYDADMANSAGYGIGMSWGGAPLENSVWYVVDQYIRMNTPGVHDGVLSASINGVKVFERTDLMFRTVDTLHVGNVWFNFYYGGSGVAPRTMWVDLDDVVVEW